MNSVDLIDSFYLKTRETAMNSVDLINSFYMTKIRETIKSFDAIITKSRSETEDARSNELMIEIHTQKINELYVDIHKDLQKLFEETSVLEINDIHYKKKLSNINQVV
jgi:hypothetical protein